MSRLKLILVNIFIFGALSILFVHFVNSGDYASAVTYSASITLLISFLYLAQELVIPGQLLNMHYWLLISGMGFSILTIIFGLHSQMIASEINIPPRLAIIVLMVGIYGFFKMGTKISNLVVIHRSDGLYLLDTRNHVKNTKE